MSSTSGEGESRKQPSPGQTAEARGVLHQRSKLPYKPTTMAVGGLLIAGAIGYFTLYYKSKPGTTHEDLAKTVVVGKEEGRHINK